MDPLDFLKQKVSQGLSDVENWGSDAGNDVTTAIHSVFNTTPQQTQQVQQPTAQPQQSAQINLASQQNMAKINQPQQTPLPNVQQPTATKINQVAPPPPTVPIAKPKNVGGLSSLVKLQMGPAPKNAVQAAPPKVVPTSGPGGLQGLENLGNKAVALGERPFKAIASQVAAVPHQLATSPLATGIKVGAAELTNNQAALKSAKSQGAANFAAQTKQLTNPRNLLFAGNEGGVVDKPMPADFGLKPGVKPEPTTTAKVNSLPTEDRIAIAANKARTSPDGIKEQTTDTDRVISNSTGELPEEVAAQRLAGQRNADAELKVQQILSEGGDRQAAIQAYMKDTGVSQKMATYRISQVAKQSKLALKPNPEGVNPLAGKYEMPVAKANDFDQAPINRNRVNGNIDLTGTQAIRDTQALSDTDKENFKGYMQGTKDPAVAEDPGAVVKAMASNKTLFDTTDAEDKGVGGMGRYIEQYFPDYWDRDDPATQAQDQLQAEQDLEEEVGPETWNKMTPQERAEALADRNPTPISDGENFGQYKGFHTKARVFANEEEGLNAKMKPLNPGDPVADLQKYVASAKYNIGNQAFKKAASEADAYNEKFGGGTVRYGPGEKDNIPLSKPAYDRLKGEDINAGKSNPLVKANRAIRKSLIALGVPHLIIVPPRALGARLTELTPNINAFSDDLKSDYKPSANIVDLGNRVDSPLHGSRYNAGVGNTRNPLARLVYNNVLPRIHESLLKGLDGYLQSHGIDPDSAEARGLGHQINAVMGYSRNKGSLFEESTFAPALIKSTATMYRQALTPGGTIARGGVLGQQAMNEALGFISKGISNQIAQSEGKPQNKSKDNAASTFWSELLGPKIYTPFQNKNKEQIVLGIPGQYQADVARIAFNQTRGNNGQLGIHLNTPSQAFSSAVQTAKDIASPIASLALSAATNKTYSGQQVRNPFASLPTQIAQFGVNAGAGALPINFQAPADAAISKALGPTFQNDIPQNQTGGPVLRAVTQTLGLNPKSDTTTGAGPAIQTYYNGLTKGQDYISANSANPQTLAANETAFSQYYARAKNNNGQTILLSPTASKANSALLASNPTVLAGIQVAEKANGKGNYNPIWDLPTDKLQAYMTYESLADGDPNRTVMEQKDPWLITEFGKEQTYFNSIQNTSTAVTGKGYVAYPPISSSQSDMMSQVSTLSGIENRTPAQETQLTNLENNTSLQAAYTLLDNYTNARRQSEGLSAIPYPSASLTPSQSALLTQEENLATGTKSAFIRANQTEWNQISNVLAQDTIYNVEKQGGVIQQGGTEPDFLKNTYEAGQYDIAAPASGTAASGYTLNPTLAYQQGASSSQTNPLVPLPPRPKRPKKMNAKKPRMAKFKHIKRQQTAKVTIGKGRGLKPTQVLRPTQVAKLAT